MTIARKTLALWLAIAILGAGLLALLSRPKRTDDASPSPGTVAVTSYPLYDTVRSVAADIKVVMILPPGADPHTFEPTPSTLAALSEARAVYAIGHGFDDWVDPLLRDAAAEKVVVDRGISLRPTVEPFGHDDDEEEESGPVDPHYWLDVRNMRVIARTVAEDLMVRFPERSDAINTALSSALDRLEAADARIREVLAPATKRDIVTLHDAWYYFAEAYGLTIVGSFEPSAAREPTPQYLAALQAAIRRTGVNVLYRDLRGTAPGLEPFIEDNGLRLVDLDPVEGASQDGYVTIMIRNAEIIKENQR